MTLDEAIKHAEEKAKEQQSRADNWIREWDNGFVNYCNKCAEEHRQLAEWLKELKQLREQADGDLISKQMVLDVIEREEFKGDAISEIEKLPSVRPQEPKTGHWIIHGEPPINVIECSECGQKYHNHYHQPLAHFCSMCGAEMFEPQDIVRRKGTPREDYEPLYNCENWIP